MMDMDSSQRRQLHDAYGSAEGIPDLLGKLAGYPSYTSYESEPYFSLWSALCHQGDVYPASYAALPYIVNVAEENPAKAHWDLVLLPTCIEIARLEGRGPELPPHLANDYSAAIIRLPKVTARMHEHQIGEVFARVAAAGVAIACGQLGLAKSTLELTPDVVPDFLEWVMDR
jgi:hypothetical protein